VPNTFLSIIAGFHQFYGLTKEHFIQTSVNAKYVYQDMPKWYAYANAGAGAYKAQNGILSWGIM